MSEGELVKDLREQRLKKGLRKKGEKQMFKKEVSEVVKEDGDLVKREGVEVRREDSASGGM